jgi:hypothetical protein
VSLKNIKLGVSPLTNEIMLYRHGKDPRVALERREAEADVMIALVNHMLEGRMVAVEKLISIGGKQFAVRVTPISGGAA